MKGGAGWKRVARKVLQSGLKRQIKYQRDAGEILFQVVQAM
jgi:hypothetical protein